MTSINKINHTRNIKTCGIIGLIFIILALIIIGKTPLANGYEISIYRAYNPYFWIFIISALSCGIIILVYQAFTEQKSYFWPLGLFITIFTNLIILLLPIFRGYFVSDLADELDHLGNIQDIILTGKTGAENVYPVSHIFSVILSYISGLNPNLIIQIVPSIFFLIYLSGLFFLAKEIGKTFGQVLLVMAFGSVLIFTYYHVFFLPTQFFLDLVPFILMIFLKRNSSTNYIEFRIILLIMLLLMPFMHPLGSFLLILVFFVLDLSILIQYIFKPKNTCQIMITHPTMATRIPILIVSIVFLAWFAKFAMFQTTFVKAFDWFVYGHGKPPLESIGEQLQMSGFTVLDFIDLLVKTYGQDLIYIFLSLIAIFIVLRNLRERNISNIGQIFFSLLFLISGVFYFLTLKGSFVATGTGIRIFCWALMSSTLLNGLVYHDWISKLRGKMFKIHIYLLTIIIIIATIIGIFNVYYSPNVQMSNLQVTKMNYYGMVWFFENTEKKVTIYFDQLPFGAVGTIYGLFSPKPETIGYFSLVPKRLNYIESKNLTEQLSYEKDLSDAQIQSKLLIKSLISKAYIVISKRIRITKTELWPDIGLYTLDDLNRLDFEPTINKIYFNGDLEIWKISTKN